MNLIEAIPYMLDGTISRIYRETELGSTFAITLDDKLRFWYDGQETTARGIGRYELYREYTPVFSKNKRYAPLASIRHMFRTSLRRVRLLTKGRAITLKYMKDFTFKKLEVNTFSGELTVVEVSVFEKVPVTRLYGTREDLETKWRIHKRGIRNV